MKTILELHDFKKAFHDINSTNFSHEGLETLFEYLSEIESEYELDARDICRDFIECSLDEFLALFNGVDVNKTMSNDEKVIAIQEYLGKNGFWFDFVNNNASVIYEN